MADHAKFSFQLLVQVLDSRTLWTIIVDESWGEFEVRP